jgi:hypothetical protein
MEVPRLNKAVSQRLVVSLVGIAVIQASWRWATEHFYSLPPEAFAGFVTITANSMYVTGAIVVFMVTGRMVYDWKMGTSQVQEVVSSVAKVKEEIVEYIQKPKNFDDETI